jgi:dTDP-4-amino-4,6-dideoxygalactose transaminase
MDMQIPFFDLKQQYRGVADEVNAALRDVFEDLSFTGGPEVARFEEEFARYCGVMHCVGVNSGTSALHLALLGAGVGPGDEVITTPMTFVATIAAIEYCGATPVLVDCDPATLTIDPVQIASKITPITKAIIPVHLHGFMADMMAIEQIADRAGIAVVEDASQAHGALQHGRRAGAFGRLGCFSFYPSKNLGAYGEAGAVTTNDAQLAQHLRKLRNWGSDEAGLHEVRGFNYRLSGLQAAVLRVKLRHLERWNENRRALAARYTENLWDLDVVLPPQSTHDTHAFHVYAIRTPRRDALRAWLKERGIGTHIHYAVPVHMQPAYRRTIYPQGSFPVSEKAAEELLSLPLYPEMHLEQVDLVCTQMRAFFRTEQ